MRIAIVYNKPCPSRYDAVGEEKAVLGVLHEVSSVHQALLELNHDITTVPLVPPLAEASRKLSSLNADLAFNLFEGFCGHPETEALVPEILSDLRIPYTGCPGEMLRLALDKAENKALLKTAGIPTPDFQLLNPQTLHIFQLNYPCIVKPRREDASHGITGESVVNTFTSLEKQVKTISNTYADGALVEEFIDGREFNTTVWDNPRYAMLPSSEIVYSLPIGVSRILTFAAKWEPDSLYFQGTRAICPAEIGTKVQKRLDHTAHAVFHLLGGQGYIRVDMRMNKEGQLIVIDVNPNPDISPESGAVRQIEAAGISYTQFIEEIIRLALEDKYHENKDPRDAERRQSSPDEDTTAYARIQGV
jgi:D-alanine-D-alanine ligase